MADVTKRTAVSTGEPGAIADYDSFAALVRARRTSMLVDEDREVPVAVVEELCDLATSAPNHKQTRPWRFTWFTGVGRARLGETMVADMIDADFGDEDKRTKTATKYLRTPGILVVGCAPHENDMLHRENRDAVAAGMQNMLLGATALGVASFWSTPAITSPPQVLDLCGFERDDRIVGLVYLGWATGQNPSGGDRPGIEVRHIDG